MNSYEEKCEKLYGILKELTKENIAVAFSGGVDSSLLLKAASDCASENGTTVYAVTADSELSPSEDLAAAVGVAEEIEAKHLVIKVDVLGEASVSKNPPDRCYHCKKSIFGSMKNAAEKLGAALLADGTNADDMKAYRPGIRALKELEIRSPLKEAGMTKEDIRRLAGELRISVAERPSAPCLATRFPYGELLSEEKLRAVEKGEAFLKKHIDGNIRLRVHGEIARIEAEEAQMTEIFRHREKITSDLKTLGYHYITLDLEGFRSGSMDVNIVGEHL